MSIQSDVLERAESYVRGRLDLATLDIWLAQHAREIAQLPEEDAAARIAGLVDVSVAEMQGGLIDDAQIRVRVGEMLRSDALPGSAASRPR